MEGTRPHNRRGPRDPLGLGVAGGAGTNGTRHEPPQLDEVDRGIIESLGEDARMSFSEIARRLDVSPGMVRKRYHRMVEEGLLHVQAITNPLLTGRNVWAMVAIDVEAGRLEEVADRIAELDEVIYLIVTAGSHDLMAEVFARDHGHLLDVVANRLQKLEGVRETETWMNLRIVKETYY